MENSPWDEGKLAASNGEPATASPYEADTVEYSDWEAGHESVSDLDEDGEYVDEADRP